jgi:prepilin-type N-terminal cleavage/methylation domain-containing protein
MSANHPERDEAGMTLVELMVAMTLFVVVITIGFVVTTTMLTATTATQRTGFLTGPAQDGIQTLRDVFAGAVPARTVSTLAGTQLYTNGCIDEGPGQTFVSESPTAVSLCSVRSGSSTAYTYEIRLTACDLNGICTLDVEQLPSSVPVAVINNVCGSCKNVTNTSFTFTPSASPLTSIQSVSITLTVASTTAKPVTTAHPVTTDTVTTRVMLPNAQGGAL